jgi:hypothetical protein
MGYKDEIRRNEAKGLGASLRALYESMSGTKRKEEKNSRAECKERQHRRSQSAHG